MRFESPLMLLLLLLLPFAAWGWLRANRSAAMRYSSLRVLRGVPRSVRGRVRPALLAMRLLALGLLILALARPQTGLGHSRISTEGVAIQMVIDRSGSMGEQMEFDGQAMNRLDVVKRVFRDFVLGDGGDLPGRPDDLVGVVSFARYADTVCPLVRDPQALVALTEQLQLVTLRTEDGTAIGDGVALAAARLRKAEEELEARTRRLKSSDPPSDPTPGEAEGPSEPKSKPEFTIRSKVIILLTDGQANAGDISPEEAARIAKEWGIKIYAIGIGGGDGFMTMKTPAGEMRVPMGRGIDDRTLREVARITDGRAWLASDAESLRQIYEEIDRLEKTRIESVEFTEHEERFLPFAMAALALAAAECVLGATFFRKAP